MNRVNVKINSELVKSRLRRRGWTTSKFALESKIFYHTAKKIVEGPGPQRLHDKTIEKICLTLDISRQEILQWSGSANEKSVH
jgi:predicted transcriptional regulator